MNKKNIISPHYDTCLSCNYSVLLCATCTAHSKQTLCTHFSVYFYDLGHGDLNIPHSQLFSFHVLLYSTVLKMCNSYSFILTFFALFAQIFGVCFFSSCMSSRSVYVSTETQFRFGSDLITFQHQHQPCPLFLFFFWPDKTWKSRNVRALKTVPKNFIMQTWSCLSKQQLSH